MALALSEHLFSFVKGTETDSNYSLFTLPGHIYSVYTPTLQTHISLNISQQHPPITSSLSWVEGVACLWTGQRYTLNGKGGGSRNYSAKLTWTHHGWLHWHVSMVKMASPARRFNEGDVRRIVWLTLPCQWRLLSRLRSFRHSFVTGSREGVGVRTRNVYQNYVSTFWYFTIRWILNGKCSLVHGSSFPFFPPWGMSLAGEG